MDTDSNLLIEKIDALLPQTQCGLCTYAGCQPYAEAMVNNQENINKCLPGGISTLIELARHFNLDATPFIPDMEKKTKPMQIAKIREHECIGCTKCIQACPVDAIIGASKQMHTIITDACTGCELCIAPCPVDCIDLLPMTVLNDEEQKQKANAWRTRYQKRLARLKNKNTKKIGFALHSLSDRKTAILAAVKRTRNKNQ